MNYPHQWLLHINEKTSSSRTIYALFNYLICWISFMNRITLIQFTWAHCTVRWWFAGGSDNKCQIHLRIIEISTYWMWKAGIGGAHHIKGLRLLVTNEWAMIDENKHFYYSLWHLMNAIGCSLIFVSYFASHFWVFINIPQLFDPKMCAY